MAYQINRYDNSVLTTVQDGTVNTATDLKFIGRNFAGYGEIQNENFLFLLENFSGLNPPPKALDGQIWYDSGLQKLKFYDGTSWRITGGAEAQSVEPSGLTEGDFWWDSANDQLYVFNGLNFVLIGPQSAGDGTTQFISRQILDTNNQLRTVIQAVIEDRVVFVISYDGPFDLSPSNPIEGFDRIRPGITLVDTTQTQGGITGSDFRFWGTATNTDQLSGKTVNEFLLKDEPIFNISPQFPSPGISIGNDFKIFIDPVNNTDGIIQNDMGPQSEIRFITTDNTANLINSVIINSTGLIPPLNNVYQIGSPTNIWNAVYASEFVGTADRSKTILVLDSNTFVSGRVTATANSAAIRDSAGNLNAILFQGTATQARYADLAEKYTTDQEWPVGTAMAICEHEGHEICAASSSNLVAGVISENPAYLMNYESQGQAIALEGRVPVRVIGAVKKGQAVYVYENGVSSTVATLARVGIALESNSYEGEKLVECIIKT
jgi:hypothetical protein